MFSQTQWLKRPDATLAFHHEAAEGAPRAILIVCHGLAEHSKRYARFAAAMAARGYHVFAHDHRGHGETTAPDAPIGWPMAMAPPLTLTLLRSQPSSRLTLIA